MNAEERQVLKDWHDFESHHAGAFRLCQLQPCLDLRRLQSPNAHTQAAQGDVK